MAKKRVLYYINQFYAGIGGEDKADIGLQESDKKLGPALGIEMMWQDELEVVKTIACGDNYVNDDEKFELLLPRLREIIKEVKPDVVVAGPAFNAGRYGVACGKFVDWVRREFAIPGVTGMYWENPAVPMFVSDNFIIATPETAAGMKKALPPIASLALKLAKGEEVGPARKEGYLPRGYRYNEWHEKTGAQRTVELLVKKLRGEEYLTEVPLRGFEQVAPAQPLENTDQKIIALITTGALVPKGNPDKLKQAFSTGYGRYSLEGLKELARDEYESIHGGFDTTLVNEDPSRVVPFSPLLRLEQEGRIGGIFPWFFSTAGVGTNIKTSQDLGAQIAAELTRAGVSAAILTSTWGTCTRCGATIAKELERAGITAVLITAFTSIALSVGVNRVIAGNQFTSPAGAPELRPDREKEFQKQMAVKAIEALETPVQEPRLFHVRLEKEER